MLDWQLIFDIRPFAWTELGTALLCGFIIGWLHGGRILMIRIKLPSLAASAGLTAEL